MDWIDLAQDRNQWRAPVNTKNVGKFLSSWATGGFSRRAQLRGVSYYGRGISCDWGKKKNAFKIMALNHAVNYPQDLVFGNVINALLIVCSWYGLD
jgi:hypothetical protein